MAQIQAIKRKSEGYGNMLGLAGQVVGGTIGAITGGPGGAVTGAGIGGSLGGTVGGAVDNSQALGMQPIPQRGGEMEAMTRKQQQMGQDNLAVLQSAEANLPKLPEDMRQQYAPAILQARMAEQQRRGLA